MFSGLFGRKSMLIYVKARHFFQESAEKLTKNYLLAWTGSECAVWQGYECPVKTSRVEQNFSLGCESTHQICSKMEQVLCNRMLDCNIFGSTFLPAFFSQRGTCLHSNFLSLEVMFFSSVSRCFNVQKTRNADRPWVIFFSSLQRKTGLVTFQ